jgi:chromosome partitioning protein
LTQKTYKAQAVATLLGTTGDSVRRYVDESKIAVMRQETGPKTRIFSTENVFDLANWRETKKGKKRAKRPVVMTVYAPKGGVGKTTLSSNLACIFPLMGLKTLAIDLDFQSNLTLSFGYDSELSHDEAVAAKIPLEKCVEYHLGHLFSNWPTGSVSLGKVIKKPYGEHGPHILPSDVTLDRLDALLTFEAISGRASEGAINKFLVDGRSKKTKAIDLSEYDVIMFDAAPAKNRMTRGALLASDYVVAPISLEKFSTKAVSYLSDVLREMQAEHERSPELIIVGNFFDQNRSRVLSQLATIRTTYNDQWLDSIIRRSEDFPKTLSSEEYDLPLYLSKPTSMGASDIRVVAEALMKRMGVID